MRPSTFAGVCALVVFGATDARAEDVPPLGFVAGTSTLYAFDAPLAFLKQPPILRAARGGGGPRPGWIVGADTGWSTRFAEGGNASAQAWGFGARVGYAFGGGFQVDGRYDYLGVRARDLEHDGSLQAATFGARYELPLFVLPFAEARVGPSFDGSGAWFAAALALGVAVPVARPLSIDLTVRDWLISAPEALRSVLTVQLGLTLRFGG